VTEVRTVRRQKGRVNFKDGGSQLELDRIVAELQEERDRLDQAITLLRELDHTATAREGDRHQWQGLHALACSWPDSSWEEAPIGADEEALGREKKKGQIFLTLSIRSSIDMTRSPAECTALLDPEMR
jgi:hypothetical protein